MNIRTGTIQEAVDLAKRMPDFSNPYNLNSPDTPPPQLDHVLVAEIDGTAVGFRAGCRHSPDTFAVWLAGVLPSHRRQGIGGALYRCQKDWLKSQGYKFLRTHVRNSNRVMLKILVDKGYHVVDVVRYHDVRRNKIVFIKNLWERDSKMVASDLAVGLLRSGDVVDPQLRAKLRDLTISWLRFKYRGRVIEDDTINAILDRALESGHKYCLILNHGSIVSHAWELGFVRTLEDWANAHEFFIAGEILPSHDSCCGISTHSLLVDLSSYQNLSTPEYGSPGNSPVEVSLPTPASLDSNPANNDQCLRPSGDKACKIPTAPGWSFVSASLAAGLPVQRLPASMSDSILNVTPQNEIQSNSLRNILGNALATEQLDPAAFSPDQLKFLTAVQRQVQNSRRGIFVWNFESYDDVVAQSQTKAPVSTLYSVAAGLKTSWILHTLGFNEHTKLIYFDYSEQALTFKKLLHTQWNGEDYPEFLRYLFSQLQPGQAFYQLWGGFSPENIGWDAVNETWAREIARWGGEHVIKEHWRRAQDLHVEYVLCNLLEDQSTLIDTFDNRPNSVIWWSNVFFTFYSNWFLSIEERQAIYERFIRALAERSPELLIYGNDYNNLGITSVRAADYAEDYFQTEENYLEPRKIRSTDSVR